MNVHVMHRFFGKEMAVPLQHFDPRAHKRATPPYVRLDRGFGRFVLNHAALDLIGNPPFVELMIDLDSMRVGFVPRWERTPRTFTLSKLARSYARRVGAQSFGRTYGINPDRPSTHAADLENGVLVISLKDEIQNPDIRTARDEEPAAAVA